MSTAERPTSSADGVAWDLSDLYSGPDDPKITADLEESLRRAQAFESTYRGKIDVEGGPPADLLAAALAELETATELIGSPAVARYRHHLEQLRAWRPHYLTEPEEKVLEEKSVTGRSAFVRLFEETISSLTCPFTLGGRTDTLSTQQILAKLY